jgi:hypothetical protein
MAKAPSSFWQRLQQIPRAYVYLLLVAVVTEQLLFPKKLPISAGEATRGVYTAIQAAPEDRLILVSADWDASTMPETGPQTAAIAHACFQMKKKFAIMSLAYPMSPKLAHDIIAPIAKQYGARYGVDWCNWGYKFGTTNVMLSMAKNLPRALGEKDYTGARIADLPIMRGRRNISDIGLVIEVTGLASFTEYWIGLIQGPYGTPLVAGYTAVMAPGYYPYLDAQQIRGMLIGVRGGAEMEVLVNRPGKATEIMPAQSAAHLLIIALILLGNVGYVATRRRPQEGAG